VLLVPVPGCLVVLPVPMLLVPVPGCLVVLPVPMLLVPVLGLLTVAAARCGVLVVTVLLVTALLVTALLVTALLVTALLVTVLGVRRRSSPTTGRPVTHVAGLRHRHHLRQSTYTPGGYLSLS
jgi:hypothetical protein